MSDYRQRRMKTVLVVGARPDFIKAAPILDRSKRFLDYLEPVLVHTGQHHDSSLSGSFFAELGMAPPDIHLGTGSGSHCQQTAAVLTEFEKSLLEIRPHLVMVFGNSDSAAAAAMAAAKGGMLVAHVESGLRFFDTSHPEEINRLIIDRVSDFHFIGESSGFQNLVNEGYDQENLYFVGNVLIDTLEKIRVKSIASEILNRLELRRSAYALLSIHQPFNVDEPSTLRNILIGVSGVARRIPVIFPCHSPIRINIDNFNLTSYFGRDGIRLIEPPGCLDFLKLESEAALVLTDSGGIQEETTILNVPCLTLRRSTDRQVTVSEGTNLLVGPYPEKIAAAAENILNGAVKTGSIPKYWDGRAAERIVDIVLNIRRTLFEPEPAKKGTAKLQTVREALTSGQ